MGRASRAAGRSRSYIPRDRPARGCGRRRTRAPRPRSDRWEARGLGRPEADRPSARGPGRPDQRPWGGDSFRLPAAWIAGRPGDTRDRAPSYRRSSNLDYTEHGPCRGCNLCREGDSFDDGDRIVCGIARPPGGQCPGALAAPQGADGGRLLAGGQLLLRAVQKLDRGRMPVELVGLNPGDEVELSRELVVKAFPTRHTIPSLGFLVWERR